jgi:hypothetical protein
MSDRENQQQQQQHSWCIEIVLCRTYDGSYEDAVALAEQDFDYYQSQVDGGDNVNSPCGMTIQELPYRGEGHIKSEEITLVEKEEVSNDY